MAERPSYPVLVLARDLLQREIVARHKIRQTIKHNKILAAWDFCWKAVDDDERAQLAAVESQIEEIRK